MMHVGKQKLEHIKDCVVCRARIAVVIAEGMTPEMAVRAYRSSVAKFAGVSR